MLVDLEGIVRTGIVNGYNKTTNTVSEDEYYGTIADEIQNEASKHALAIYKPGQKAVMKDTIKSFFSRSLIQNCYVNYVKTNAVPNSPAAHYSLTLEVSSLCQNLILL